MRDGTECGSFDKAYLLHVGMNISDKVSLMKSIAQQIKPGGFVGVYDIMRCGSEDDPLEFPLPWASAESQNSCTSPEIYRAAFEAAGLDLLFEENRAEFALGSFNR